MDDIYFMKLALAEAEAAFAQAEVPVGAAIADETGAVLAAARNQTLTLCDPSAHAEMLAIRKACKAVGNYRLLNAVLYVTVEPCIMCMGAVVHARMARVVFGVHDPKWGAAGSLFNFAADDRLNHRLEIQAGVCKDACRALMQDFFRARRNMK